MAEYDFPYSSEQIEAALDKIISPDTTPQSGSGKMVTSGGVESRISAESDARVAADDDLGARVTALENSVKIATVADGSTTNGTHTFSGYSLPMISGVSLSEPSTGTLRISGTGVYRVTWFALFYEQLGSGTRYSFDFSINGKTSHLFLVGFTGISSAKPSPVSLSTMVDLDATMEVDIEIRATRNDGVSYGIEWSGFRVVLEKIA